MNSLKVDLHIHSKYSEDGSGEISELLDFAIEKDLDAIAITDHDTLEGNKEAQQLSEDRDIFIIPGQEVTTKDGHLLVLGINEEIEPHQGLRETLDLIEEEGGFTIAPHPFHRYRHGIGGGLKRNYEKIDAIEVFNSRYITGIANKRAKWFSKNKDIPMVAGSDAHIPEVIGYGTTIVYGEKTVEGVLEAISENKTDFEAKKTPIALFLKQAWSSFFGSVKRGVRNRLKH